MIGKAQVILIQSLKINESKNKDSISMILREFLVLQNIYTSNNPNSNFELYDTRIN